MLHIVQIHDDGSLNFDKINHKTIYLIFIINIIFILFRINYCSGYFYSMLYIISCKIYDSDANRLMF